MTNFNRNNPEKITTNPDKLADIYQRLQNVEWQLNRYHTQCEKQIVERIDKLQLFVKNEYLDKSIASFIKDKFHRWLNK